MPMEGLRSIRRNHKLCHYIIERILRMLKKFWAIVEVFKLENGQVKNN